MKIFVVDAFANERFMGNQAGVAILGTGADFPADEQMLRIAAELKHSETAFVQRKTADVFAIRYFTPVEEVDLCGHATISVFTVLRETGLIGCGEYIAVTRAGRLHITVEARFIWMDMADPVSVRSFLPAEAEALYAAYGLDLSAVPDGLWPEIIKTGLSDILLPVNEKDILDEAVMDAEAVKALSQRYQVTGVHMFCPGAGEIAAYCRNFAPLYDIPEEAATGTSNGGLTYYLNKYSLLPERQVNRFIQGERMGRISSVYTTIDGSAVRVGGEAVISLTCTLYEK